MSVSANSLFHFTNFEALKGIIGGKGFWPKYSKEIFDQALPLSSNYHIAHIPMVCFCDLKLTQLCDKNGSSHTKDFGEYGIGFKKGWGIQNKISPVSYIHKESIAAITIDGIISTINEVSSKKDTTLVHSLGEIVKFLKPYNGHYQKGSRRKSLITYYDEREWRYIPPGKRFKVIPEWAFREDIMNELNRLLQNKPLRFSSDDVKYIIISNEREKAEMAKVISSAFSRKSDYVDLVSKIITQDEIAEDF